MMTTLWLKGKLDQRSIASPIGGNGIRTKCIRTAVFPVDSDPLCEKLNFESCKDMTECCHFVPSSLGIGNVINKASQFGKSGKYITSQPFYALHW